LPETVRKVPSLDESDADVPTAEVQDLISWLVEGYSEPRTDAEVVDPDTGRVLVVAEALWEAGLQEGRGQPIVLELDSDGLDEEFLQTLGYLVFTSCSSLRDYVRRHHEGAA
jgi:hypothetical protein